ncbi:hypothetical protein GGI12_001737 [Dipsacomyces acuminosporus]|nr:hypothetical protein GGI12_001737 [Dipsacomyces acuminosporus]
MSTTVLSAPLPSDHTENNWQGWDTIYVPHKQSEVALFYTVAAINLLSIPIIVYSFYYRSYLPIKAKNVWISAGIGIGSLVYNFAYNVTLGMVGYGGWYQPCRLWSAWLMFTFGMGVVLSFISLRLIFYYRIFITRRTHIHDRFTMWGFCRRWWPFFALWAPTLLSSIVAQALPASFSIRSIVDHGIRTCDFNFNYLYWVFAYFAAQMLVAWGLYFRMRKIAKAFNEFRTAIWTLILYTIVLVSNIGINCAGGTVHTWGRITLCLINTIMFNMHYWMITLPPIFGHIFRREETLKRFIDEMHEDGLVAKQARLGNAHNHLYGFKKGEEGYMDTSTDNQRSKTSAANGVSRTCAQDYPESVSDYFNASFNETSSTIHQHRDHRQLV